MKVYTLPHVAQQSNFELIFFQKNLCDNTSEKNRKVGDNFAFFCIFSIPFFLRMA
jgi:hypothetical protein